MKYNLNRTSENSISLEAGFSFPITIFANQEVQFGSEAIEELISLLEIDETNQKLKNTNSDFFGNSIPKIHSVVLTPDFHKGSGVPIGTVLETENFILPQAVGNDVCCGMRLLVCDAPKELILGNIQAVKQRLREIFFQGQRNIPMSPMQRESMLRYGLYGLLENCKDNQNTGLWEYFNSEVETQNLDKTHFQGSLSTNDTFAFDAYILGSGASDGRDIQIGSVGGGNHFVEIQSIDEICDGSLAHSWGVKENQTAIMIHTGSVGLGHTVGGWFAGRALEIYPPGLTHPKNGFYPLPTQGPHAQISQQYLSAMGNAGNFAFANRLFLGLMTIKALSEVLGKRISHNLIYDAPHNLIWKKEENKFLHRKGATPAIGANGNPIDRFGYSGQPVIIPGSMGSASYLLAGGGLQEGLESACHGAGRALTRGKSSHVSDEQYQTEMRKLHVVTPIDPDSPQLKSRQDILSKYHARMKEEAPFAYKSITPIIDTVHNSGMAKKVAKLWPILTVKG